jgi:hypothetical protein
VGCDDAAATGGMKSGIATLEGKNWTGATPLAHFRSESLSK